jgi:hypothetical protein
MNHNVWASEYFTWKNKGDFFKANDEIEKICGSILSAYPYVALEKLNWIRILTWTGKNSKVYGEAKKPNKEQKDTIMFWCSINNIDFDNFINSYNGN